MRSATGYEQPCVICKGTGVLYYAGTATCCDVICPHCGGYGIEPLGIIIDI